MKRNKFKIRKGSKRQSRRKGIQHVKDAMTAKAQQQPTLVFTEPHRLAVRAPRRVWYRTYDGWASRPWTTIEVLEYIIEGGWFFTGAHDFVPNAAKFSDFTYSQARLLLPLIKNNKVGEYLSKDELLAVIGSRAEKLEKLNTDTAVDKLLSVVNN